MKKLDKYITIVKVDSQDRGTATFMADAPEGIVRPRFIRNEKIKTYPTGTELNVEFRVGVRGQLYMQHLWPMKDDSVKIKMPTETVELVKDEDPETTKAKRRATVLSGLKEQTKKMGRWVELSNQHIFLPFDLENVLMSIDELAKRGDILNVLLVGPSGYGKTTFPEVFAHETKREYVRINCAAVRDPEEWFGYREAVDGSTKFIPTEFTQKITKGDAVVVLDEFNRVEPWLHNTLYPLLDHARKTMVHNELVSCGKNLVFFATVNLGAQFTGTFMLDAALLNRMDCVIPVGPLPAAVEALLLDTTFSGDIDGAVKIVSIMGKLRTVMTHNGLEFDASTRSSLKVGRLVSSGMSLAEAFNFVITNIAPPDAIKGITDVINNELKG